MKLKIKSKSNNHKISKRQENNNYLSVNNKQIKDGYCSKNIHPFKNRSNTKIISKTIKKKSIRHKYNKISNIDDSSTNCFSRNNNKRINVIPQFNMNLIHKQQKENFIIPFLLTKTKESDTESLFINYKLGQNDSNMESAQKSDFKNVNLNNLKINKIIKNKYNYCNVDENIGKNENDSLELYDFSDKTNVDYVLKNLSALSCSKSNKDKSSINLDDCNEGEISGNKIFINKIKIFNAKKSLTNYSSKIKGDNFF